MPDRTVHREEPSVARETLDPQLVAALADPQAALDALPAAERAEYERCRQSVIDARREGERIARELWIG